MTIAPLSPILAPDLVCVQCTKVMRRVIGPHPKLSKLEKINYYCDSEKCKYGITISGTHANMMNAPYIAPENTRELFTGSAPGGR